MSRRRNQQIVKGGCGGIVWGGLAVLGFAGLLWLWWHGGAEFEIEHPLPTSDAHRSHEPAGPTGTSALRVFGKARNESEPALMSNPVPANEERALSLDPRPQPARATPTEAVRERETDWVLALQIALANEAISPGSIDGLFGRQTALAVRAYQKREGLAETGRGDRGVLDRLGVGRRPLFRSYSVTSEDLNRLMVVGKTWLEKSEQPRLDYESVLELVAERFFSHPRLIQRLNPELHWDRILPGTEVKVPDVQLPPARARAVRIEISLSDRTLQAFAADGRLLGHFPCSIAQRVEKRPVGTLFVEVVAANPNYRFDPALFPTSAEARAIGRPLMIPPGPNNPVGTAWIGLNRPGYGIHGSPRPEDVGRTESLGCFRLANWNAEYLAQLVANGTMVLAQ
jgi:peptidoglycan hydrolase-like protein with peptidoglycan-binding domain